MADDSSHSVRLETVDIMVTDVKGSSISMRAVDDLMASPRHPPPPPDAPPPASDDDGKKSGFGAVAADGASGALEQPPVPPVPPMPLTKQQTESNLLPRSINILAANPEISTTNVVITSKYTIFTFLPFCLFELLHPLNRFANFFYLVVGAMQLIEIITPYVPPTPIAWTNLFVIVCVDLYLLGREDYNRHVADRASNNQKVDVLSRDEATGKMSSKRTVWADVRVGDVVRVLEKEAFPADLVLLRGSDPPGQCWVNTKPLDGESDMKLRLAPAHGLARPPEECGADDALEEQLDWAKLKGSCRCEKPNDKVNDFTGELDLVGSKPLILTPTNMLLRGCMLMNTEWALGLVVSSGNDTKVHFAPLHASAHRGATPPCFLHR